MYSRFEEHALTYAETATVQQRLAFYRSVTRSEPHDRPGTLLPVTFHGSPLKTRSPFVVNRRGKPHLMITVTCNPEWPEIVEKLEPHQSALDRPDLCCRVFKAKLAEIMADLKGGKVFGE